MDYITDKSKIGANLKKARKAKYKSQDAFAEAIDVSDRKTISKWETGETEIPTKRLPKICNLLECDMDFIFGKIDVFKNQTKNIMEETGLNEEAVKILTNNKYTEILNAVLSDIHFEKALEILSDCSAQQLNTSQGSIIKDRIKSKFSETSKISDGTSKVLYDISKYGLPVLYKQIVLDETSKLFDSVINKL